MCEEHYWQDMYYGRCYGCGTGYDKDSWIFELTLWEDTYEGDVTWDTIETYFINDGYNHEGNGVCSSCALEYTDSIGIERLNKK